MSLRQYNATLSSSSTTLLSVPTYAEAAVHAIYASGNGALTLQRTVAEDGSTETIVDGLGVTDEWSFPRTINLEPGDELVASDDDSGLQLTVSAYLTGRSEPGEPLAYGPGPQTLQAGDMQAGFFGEVSAGELFSGDELAFLLGVTEGTSQFSDAGWLKFAHNGEIKYIAKKTIRHSISWDHLYSRGLVYGTDDTGKAPRGTPVNQYTTLERAGHTFVCRLLTGANADPFDESDSRFFTDDMCELDMGGGSEWNELIYRIHQLEPDCPATNHRADRSGGPQSGSNWESYTDSDLQVGGGNGRQTWCQEQSEQTSSRRVYRGHSDVAYFRRASASGTVSARGWRPALVLIPNN